MGYAKTALYRKLRDQAGNCKCVLESGVTILAKGEEIANYMLNHSFSTLYVQHTAGLREEHGIDLY